MANLDGFRGPGESYPFQLSDRSLKLILECFTENKMIPPKATTWKCKS